MDPRFAGTAQQIEIDGESNEAYMAAGDMYVGGSHVHHDAREDFVRLSLDTLRLSSAPREAPGMVRMLRDYRALVLGGRYDDKPTVARQLAAMLAQQSPAPLPVLEWNQGSDLPDLLRAVRKLTEPSLLLLPAIEPRHVRHDPRTLFVAAAATGHYVLVTTDVAQAAWRLTREESAFWIDLDPDGLFADDTLASELVLHLAGAREALAGVLREAHQPDQGMVAGVPLRELAVALRTPPSIVAFVQQLVARARAGRVDERAVRELAHGAASRDTQVIRWFHGVLAPREQLLALCLSFFDGLFEDQFFAALERWVAHIRAVRDPSVPAFDYADLDNLLTVFTPVEGSAGTRFVTRSENDRALLFQAAWRTHRRQLMGAMGVLADLVAQSAYGRGTDWELYGSRGRRSHLRRVVAAALSDLGTLSESSVERALLRLAGDGNADVQGVAANAVARWRQRGRDAQLFRLLDRWQKDARIRAMVEALMEGKEKVRTAEAHIRATVALAVGYAVDYDPPNHLHEKLVDLFRDLAGDRNPVVRRRFANHTLPRAVAQHLAQLRGVLRHVAGFGLEEDIARALAYAAETVPAEVAATLADWHAQAESLRKAHVDARRVTVRETLLRVLAYTYGALDYSDERRPLSADEGFGRLRAMLAGESHPAVRDAVVDAMIRQARARFGAVEALLQPMMAEVSPSEQGDVVRRLVEVYLDAREALTGQNAHVTLGGRTFPAFVDIPRPLTAVEVAMMRWMRDPAHRAAQRIGIRALLAFIEAVDGPERRELARISDERRTRAAEAGQYLISSAPVRYAQEHPGWYEGTLVPWLATTGVPHLRPVIAGVLPEALAQHRARPMVLQFALERWESMRDTGTRSTAQRIRSALSWHANAWVVVVFGGFAVLMLLVVLVSVMSGS